MEQPRLWLPAVEAVMVTCNYVPRQGWVLTVRSRRQFDTWAEGFGDDYPGLTTDELVSLIGDVIERALDPPQ